MTKTVLIADDHALSAMGLQHALEAHGGFACLATVSNGIDAITQSRRLSPDLVILDYGMPAANGLEAHIEIKRWNPETRTVIVTGQSRQNVLASLRSHQVDGVFLKNQSLDELVAGIVQVASGTVVYPDASSQPQTALSAREFEVLCKVADGLSVRDIADALSLSPKTIETHKASLMRKLGVNSSTSLIVTAVKRGLLDLSS